MFVLWDGLVDNISIDARGCNFVERICNHPVDYAVCVFPRSLSNRCNAAYFRYLLSESLSV